MTRPPPPRCPAPLLPLALLAALALLPDAVSAAPPPPGPAPAAPAAASRLDPPDADAWRLSYAAEGRGDFGAALAALDRATPGASPYLLTLRRGWLLHLAGRHGEAAEAYQRAVGLEPRAVEPRVGGMLPLMAARRWKDAERLGEEALALAPGDLLALSRLAWTAYNQAQWPRAEALYRKVLELWPGSAELRAGLGWTLLKAGRVREARAELERAAAYAPDLAPVRDGLAALPPG